MSANSFKESLNSRAQTAIELAIFGAILIYVMSLIVNSALSYDYVQNQNYKAMRLAMTLSHQHSEGLTNDGGGADGDQSRNTSSVLFVEDRLVAETGKYLAVNRMPQIYLGAGTHTRNLYMPFDEGESHNIPVIDVYVNGIHIPLSVGALTNNLGDPNNYYVQVTNHPEDEDWDPSCQECFDLNRDGTYPDVPVSEQANFTWQWKKITAADINIDDGVNVLVDVDGDLKEERLIGRPGKKNKGSTPIQALDFQEGDIDFTKGDSDPGGDEFGFSKDAQLFTYTKDPNNSASEGTYLLVNEGKLFSTNGDTRQFIRSTQRKDSVDIIQRAIKLDNNTGRFCTTTGHLQDTIGGVEGGEDNPVEVCCQATPCCFGGNSDRTCMVLGNNMLFVRSRILDRHGRRWVTDLSRDPYVNFIK